MASSQNLKPVLALVDFALTGSTLAVGVGTVFGIKALADIGFLDGYKLQLLLSCVCPGTTMLLFISPIPIVIESLRKLDVTTLPVPAFQAQAVCNILTMAYGLRIRNKVVLGNNSFGLLFQVMYLSSSHFVKSGNRHWMWHSVLLQAVCCLSVYLSVVACSLDTLGQAITLFNVMLFAVPLSKLANILKTKNCSALPTAMTVIATVANFFWSVYGLLIEDIYVLVPCLLGFILCLFQVLVILWCANQLPFDLGFILLPCRQSKKISPVEFSTQSNNIAPVPDKLGLPENAEVDVHLENPEVTPMLSAVTEVDV